MAFVNHATKEINCKIVYYGAGMCGKTTNLQYIYAQTNPMVKGKLITLPLEKERTIYFDFLPLVVGEIRGFNARFHLYSVPGQVFYDAPRKAILNGVDGVVFVVDSRRDRMDANLESFENLRINLERMGKSRESIPLVLQYNKRDARDPVPLEELERIFNKHQWPHYEAVAKSGGGVFDTLKAIGKVVLRSLKETGL
jgi:signal recognition particle receptor subunit beta